jgi:hypothetical protein
MALVRNVYKILIGNCTGMRATERLGMVDNIKVDLRGIAFENWTYLNRIRIGWSGGFL